MFFQNTKRNKKVVAENELKSNLILINAEFNIE